MGGRKRNEIPEADVRAAIKAGESRKSIAAKYKMSASSFAHWCRVRGIPPEIGNLRVDERYVMPDGLNVRTLDDLPRYLFGEDGRVYSAAFDPPREVQGADKGHVVRIRAANKHISVAREMCRAWHGAPFPGAVVKYHDGQYTNLAPSNLYWGTVDGRVSAEEFIRAWQASESIAEVADRIGCQKTAAYIRASKMRERGIPLKDLGKRTDWDAMADLARKLIDGGK